MLNLRWISVGLVGCFVWGCDGDSGADESSSPAMAVPMDSALESGEAELDAASTRGFEDAESDAAEQIGEDDTETPDEDIAFLAPLPAILPGESLPVTSAKGIAVQPAVTIAGDGRWFVAFTGGTESSSDLSIFGQWEGEEAFLLHEESGEGRNVPAVCTLSNGDVMVVWSVVTNGMAPAANQIGFVRVTSEGISEEQRVETQRDGNHWLGDVACSPTGGFVITGVWPELDHPTWGAFYQHYDSEGIPMGDAIPLNPYDSATETEPVVAWVESLTFHGWLELEGNAWFSAAEATEPVLLSDDGAALVMAADSDVGGGVVITTTNSLSLILQWISETGTLSEPFFVPGDAPNRHTAGVTTIERTEAAALIHLTSEGANSKVIAQYVGIAGAMPTVLESGSIPPYPPSIAYRNGTLAAAWTVPDETHQYSIRIQVW